MRKKTLDQFVRHWDEVTDLPPQSVGIFTPWYKEVTKRLKIMPWPFLLIGAVGVAFVLYLLFGSAIVSLTSMLQRGF
jgi:hypothetical protein